jgi:hypothetical protein
MSYDKMTKKELFDICEKLNLSSYKSKNKPELILMIEESMKSKTKEKKVNVIKYVDEEEEIFTDEETEDNKTIENLLEKFENIVIETSEQIQKNKYERKIDELYKLLHKANVTALNFQFKNRAKFPVAVYNNLEMLKQRINVYNEN